jgi:hypothetical protein
MCANLILALAKKLAPSNEPMCIGKFARVTELFDAVWIALAFGLYVICVVLFLFTIDIPFKTPLIVEAESLCIVTKLLALQSYERIPPVPFTPKSIPEVYEFLYVLNDIFSSENAEKGSMKVLAVELLPLPLIPLELCVQPPANESLKAAFVSKGLIRFHL